MGIKGGAGPVEYGAEEVAKTKGINEKMCIYLYV
jgi:hypothetical protein